MPEDGEPEGDRVTVDGRTLAKLDPEMLARLRSEFGISVELKSVKPGPDGFARQSYEGWRRKSIGRGV